MMCALCVFLFYHFPRRQKSRNPFRDHRNLESTTGRDVIISKNKRIRAGDFFLRTEPPTHQGCVFAIYQIVLGRKNIYSEVLRTYYYETDELPQPKANPTQEKLGLKVAFGGAPLFSHSE